MLNKKTFFCFSFFFWSIALFLLQSCSKDDFSDQEFTKENINKASKEIEPTEMLKKIIRSSPDSIKILEEIEELRIDTANLTVTVEVLTFSSRLKTRSEPGNGIGYRYGITITQSQTLLDHKIYVIYTEINNDYTIENLSYTISGLSLGSISTSASNVTKSSSTASSFETNATWEINYGVGTYTDTRRYRWSINFNGGSSISFSASVI